jgi:hypothetical protein
MGFVRRIHSESTPTGGLAGEQIQLGRLSSELVEMRERKRSLDGGCGEVFEPSIFRMSLAFPLGGFHFWQIFGKKMKEKAELDAREMRDVLARHAHEV